MNKTLKLDPLSEYYRECRYCKDKFMANHQLRSFCPEKYGISNYCKYRYKVLLQGARLAGDNVIVNHKDSIIASPGVDLVNKALDGHASTEAANDYAGVNSTASDKRTTAENIQVIDILMQKSKGESLELSLREISNAGLDILTYDSKRKLPGCDLFFIEIGNYALFWIHKNKILITTIAETLWI